MECKHEQFQSQVNIFRLSEEEGAEINGYVADITISCTECGIEMEFIGLPQGSSPYQPMVSIDCTEARMPIRPSNKPRILGINVN